MKRAVALVALGAVLVFGAASHGGTTALSGHGVLYVGTHGILLWRSGQSPYPLGPANPDERSPQWSPNGRSIAFVENPRDSTNSEAYDVYVMRADGSHVRRVTSDALRASCPCVQAHSPSWSPEGRRIVFLRDGYSSSKLIILNLHSGGRRTLRVTPMGNVDPAWGKAGIAFVADNLKIELLNPTSGAARVLPTRRYPDGLAWSSRRVLAALEGRSIVLYNASGNVVGHLPFPRGTRGACALAWSPSGKQIVVRSPTNMSALWTVSVASGRWQRLPVTVGADNYGQCGLSWR